MDVSKWLLSQPLVDYTCHTGLLACAMAAEAVRQTIGSCAWVRGSERSGVYGPTGRGLALARRGASRPEGRHDMEGSLRGPVAHPAEERTAA